MRTIGIFVYSTCVFVLMFSLPNFAKGADNSGMTSLLAGATPSQVTVPAGWKIYAMQDFESGQTLNGQGGQFSSPVDKQKPHIGTYSTHVFIDHNGYGPRWLYRLPPGIREVYLSYWEYLDPQGRNNDEMFIAHFKNTGSTFQEVIVDWFNDGAGNFNSLNGNLVIEPQGQYYGNIWGPANQPLGFGAGWQQWEIHFIANTPGQADGLIRVYRNGNVLIDRSNVMLNGNVDITQGGMEVQAGGTYTKTAWYKDVTSQKQCAGSRHTPGAFIGDGYGCNMEATAFTAYPFGPAAPSFHRYIDDVIVLIKSPASAPSAAGPKPPEGVSVR